VISIIGLSKIPHVTEPFIFQLRGDAFNTDFNNVGRVLSSGGTGGAEFNTDVASLDLGNWNGTVPPRNIQISGGVSL